MPRLVFVPVLLLLVGCAWLRPDKPAHVAYYEESWVRLDVWGAEQGFPPPEKLELSPLEMTITNGFVWNGLNLKAHASLVPLPTFVLHTGTNQLLLQAQTRRAYWDEVRLELGFAPKYLQGELLVNIIDLEKTIEPLLKLSPLPPVTNRMIVLDPGASDAGREREDYTLDWAQRLTPLLQQRGWTVFVTRTNWLNHSAEARSFEADIRHPGLYLNLDFDSDASDPFASGVETYCMPPAGMPSTLAASQPETVWGVLPNNAFDELNLQYAFRLHRGLANIPDLDDNGLRRSRFIHLLHDRNYPAVRISGGYLSNEHDHQLIASPEFRQVLAETVANTLN
jgi:N-acetylmuramoyl-L-alanine amidase